MSAGFQSPESSKIAPPVPRAAAFRWARTARSWIPFRSSEV